MVLDIFSDLQCYQIQNVLNQRKFLINNQICSTLSLNDSKHSAQLAKLKNFFQINAFHFFVELFIPAVRILPKFSPTSYSDWVIFDLPDKQIERNQRISWMLKSEHGGSIFEISSCWGADF